VGAGNATVTGTAGTAYDITLANGGVLSAVGSGGATATVTPA
ncbi:phage major capsid protein, partial [Mycolicibacterium fortuitum]|nr:phage major capsid protein [Mycolicibacterium fortuitum]